MKALTVIALFIAGIFAGLIISTFLYEPAPVEYKTIDTVLIRQIRDYKSEIDSLLNVLPVLRIDTIVKENIVYEIPVMPYYFNDSLPISINKQRVYIPYLLCVDGYVTNYSVHTKHKIFNVDTLWTKKELLPKVMIGGCLAAILILGIAYIIK